jgi:CDP-diglyceride synthetase
MPPPPHDSYSGVASAQTFWWVITALACLFASGVYLGGWFSLTILCTAGFSALAVIGGIDDATRKLPMARGQHVQAFVVSVASILLWSAPPICYFVGYQIGKRKPIGKGKHAAPPHGT